MSPEIVEEGRDIPPRKKRKRPDQVWNEITDRWVKKDGVLGKRIDKRNQDEKKAKKDKDKKERKEMKDKDRKERKEMKDMMKRNEMRDMKKMMDEAKVVQDALESEVKRLKKLVDDEPVLSTGLSLDFNEMCVAETDAREKGQSCEVRSGN
jgi:hypothetical protein